MATPGFQTFMKIFWWTPACREYWTRHKRMHRQWAAMAKHIKNRPDGGHPNSITNVLWSAGRPIDDTTYAVEVGGEVQPVQVANARSACQQRPPDPWCLSAGLVTAAADTSAKISSFVGELGRVP